MESFKNNLIRELRFVVRDRLVLLSLFVAAMLSIFTLMSGLKEISAERALIERVETAVTQDRELALTSQSDAGGAAYYAFHFTYDPPSDLAFAARGVRDDLPWKHRIRMLALEGQIYETDRGNPELSRVGKLDFAFVAAFLLPLLSILLLYDLRAVEARNNRWDFLSATSGNGWKLLRTRAALRSYLLLLCVVTPLLVFAFINSGNVAGIALVTAAVTFNVLVWLLIALFVIYKIESGPTVATLLLGIWFGVSVALPVAGKLLIESAIAIPEGGEILLTQRETVNGAWDLPKDNTMKPFIKRHPEWGNTEKIKRPFEWKWYYAFQQVGDQTVEPLSKALRRGIAKRDQAMSLVALVSPSLLTQRLISSATNTNVASFQRYDACVRKFHASLREFHYPMLFGNTVYSQEHISKLPTYTPCPR